MKFSLAKIWFFLSVAAMGVGYGIAANQFGWFPAPLAERAWDQLHRNVLSEHTHLRTRRVYDREGIRAVKAGEMQPGLTFLASAWTRSEELRPEFRLIGRGGEVVHKWPVERTTLFPDTVSQRRRPELSDVHGSRLLSDGDVVFCLQYIGAARISPCGEVQWTLPEGAHHSVAEGENGTFWIPGVSQTPRSASERYPDGFPGLNNPVWLERVLHVSSDGKVLRKINVLDVLYENDLERYIFKYRRHKWNKDVTHVNEVEPLPPSMASEYPLFEPGDLLVSARNLNLVFVLDPESMEVRWHATGPFIQQHDPDFVGEGWIGIFDNNRDGTERGSALGGSRIVFVQPHTDSVDIRFPTPRSGVFYTEVRGKWQQLANGNILLTETNAGRAVEVAPSGQTVWEYVHEPYDSSAVPYVTKANRVDLTREEVASWPCSSVDSVGAVQNQQTAP